MNIAKRRTKSSSPTAEPDRIDEAFLGRMDIEWLYPPYDVQDPAEVGPGSASPIEFEEEELPPLGLAVS